MRVERLVLWSFVAALMSPIPAIAGSGGMTCATAERIFTLTTYLGDTSAPGYSNPIGGMGPLPSPANDAIYYLPALGTEDAPITVVAASYNFGIFLVSACEPGTPPPIAAATGPTVPTSFQVSGLTAGATYYIIVSGNPSDQSAPEGAYTFVVGDLYGDLPVSLQGFTID
jgi:hypothetical protein